MANIKFILQYIIKPRTTGAILPSSKSLARKMTEHINFAEAECLVEYGPGTGVFTEKLLSGRRKDTELFLIERNANFCDMLREKYKNEPNLHIIEDSAENIGIHLAAQGFLFADYIISGLPFASLPPEISDNILEQTKNCLAPNGCFITFQYTLFKKKLFTKHFSKLTIKHELRNIPPAYVLTFQI
ncbi:MAG: SAM-dependent methyltransferase [Defluviitaleaceae bacterium]|nr:SAM-dependent methyltransferase [Defluviitaleaceae bacterium]